MIFVDVMYSTARSNGADVDRSVREFLDRGCRKSVQSPDRYQGQPVRLSSFRGLMFVFAQKQTIVEFLDKSRTAISRTHSTSSAPAPALSPATIAATTSCSAIVDKILHAEVANPTTLHYVNARDDAGLRMLAAEVVPSLRQRQQTLRGYISQADSGSVRVSDKVKNMWAEKLDAISVILGVLEDAEKTPTELDEQGKANRIAFFKTARQAWEINLPGVLTQLSGEMVGPYTLGGFYLEGFTVR